jgi:hypothetical protein
MALTKNKMMALTAVFVAAALYNLAVFIIPFERGSNFWAAYASTMLAMIVATATGLYAVGRGSAQSRFYGASLMILVLGYFSIQMAVGLLPMMLPAIPLFITILASAGLLGSFIILLMGAGITKNVVEDAGAKTKAKTFFIKSLQIDIEGLAARAADANAKAALKKLTEAIRFSDPMSNPQLADAENDIMAKATILTNSLDDTSKIPALCEELRRMLEERNRKCKLLK